MLSGTSARFQWETMGNLRIIPRLDIKGPNLIKGVQLEGLRVIGDPQEFAVRYYRDGADELIYMDIVASLYGRNNLSEIIRRAAQDVFIPITVGGGIRSLDDARHILRSGADKVAINTAAIARPHLITEVARRFGSQAWSCRLRPNGSRLGAGSHIQITAASGLDATYWSGCSRQSNWALARSL